MKFNQYAYVEIDPKKQIEELKNINFLPVNFEKYNFSDLLGTLFKNLLAEAKTPEAKTAKLSEFAINENETLTTFLAQNPQAITKNEFYNVALQLLGYHVIYDYDLNNPIDCLNKHALHYIDKKEFTLNELPEVFYRLLNTRSANGQILIDVMAAKGYFTQFWGKNEFLFFNGKSLPVFDTLKVIREVVYVESDLDTDEDGQPDLLQTTIFRPDESNIIPVPALYTASPYFGGIIANEAKNHNVDENLEDATLSNYPKYVAKPHVFANKPSSDNNQATEEAIHKSSYALNEYLLARGFASVFAGAIGTRGSDGLRITGAPEETESAKAIIEWLHGDRIAYTDRNRTSEVKADWCNHKIGMTGRSYLGTLQIAIATTGVAGLKTVVSEAAISSWYDYYREHGLVVAPEACQGEDLDLLAETCQSNLWDAGNYLKIKDKYEAMQQDLLKKSERNTGQYSDFWDARNYRHRADNIKCSWISVHGLNDWNVKPKNVYKIWQKVKNLPIQHHLFLHQGPHYNMNNLVSIDFTDLMNLWFCHELLNLQNNAYNQWPTVMIQDNLQADLWHQEKDWNNVDGQTSTYFLHQDGELQKAPDTQAKEQKFTDQGGKIFKQAKISEQQWQNEFIAGNERWLDQQLRFTTDEFIHTTTITGRPTIKLSASCSKTTGQLSVALVEIGTRKRLTDTPSFFRDQNQEFGYRFGSQMLQEFTLTKATPAKLITKAHINMQNYADLKKASQIKENTMYDFEFQLQPTYYRIPAGSQLALIIYSTDQAMTKRPLESEEYKIDLTKCSISFQQK